MIKIYDFFSGCGGASYGFKCAGMQVVFGLDNDPNAAQTYQTNFPEAHFIHDDIRNVSAQECEKYFDRNSPSLFCGCAPCQPFSVQNQNKKKDDKRIDLLYEFGRFVEYYLPDYIFVENVPGIQHFDIKKSPLQDFCNLLKRLGYRDPIIETVQTLHYGVPQRRKRLVIMVSKNHELQLPPITHGEKDGLQAYSTVSDWISDLPHLNAGGIYEDDPTHCSARLSPLNLKRIQATPEGGGRKDWPDDLWLDCHKNHEGHTDTYGRLRFNQPAGTLTTRCISYANGRFGHPQEDRALSAREAACLQTFPRDYIFHGPLTSKAQQIGNAVPPLMAERFGEQYLKAHFEQN